MKVIKKFNCCGKTMVIVIMKEAACVMLEGEFNELFNKKNCK